MNARTDLQLGVVHGMPNAEYHALPALGSSGLKALRRSPAHYFAQALDPDAPERATSPAMSAGTLAHCALLEPHALAERYIVRPPGLDGRTKEGKAWLAAVPVGIEAVTAEQMQTAVRQAASIRALPEVGALLERGRAEVSAFWTDPDTGAHCKCRPDWVSPAGDAGGVVLVDVKTTQDASPAGFPRSIANYGYHLQAAWYSDGYERASGQMVLGFVFACVEADYPHAAAAYMLDDLSMDKARDEIRALLALYVDCKARGEWAGYPNTIQPLSLPAWAI